MQDLSYIKVTKREAMAEMLIHRHLQLLLMHIAICRVLRKKFNGNNGIRSVLRNCLQDLCSLLSLPMVGNFHVIRLKRISSLVTLSNLEDFMEAEEIHPFADYLTKKEQACYKHFHWNLHCHKLETFFKNNHRQRNSGNYTGGNVNGNMSAYQCQSPSARTHTSSGSSTGLGRGRPVPAWIYTSSRLVESYHQVPEASMDEGQGYVT